MNRLTVALLQMTSVGTDLDANQKKGSDFCRRAKAMGADIALFPEMWSIGYHLPDPSVPAEVEAWQALAVSAGSPFVQSFQSLAVELEMAIALTYLEQWPGAPRNSVSMIDKKGSIAFTYAKVHTCDFDREALLTHGQDFPTCSLETDAGPVQVGAMICMDREFPESARILMINGAELILTPNACPLEPLRIGQYQARAYENMTAMAMANYAAPQQNGHSIAFDGIAFPVMDAESSSSMLVVEAGPQEGIYLAVFDLDALRAYRSAETMGNSFRKPSCYAPLLDPAVRPPFVRPSARR